MSECDWVVIDGSEGEGGGQLLRTSLTLSMVTGMPFEMVHIRAKRAKPGLQAQHLQALLAAQQICGATLDGAVKGSTQIRFIPAPLRGGSYRFDIGTAGATSLLLHTLYLPLARAVQPSTLQLIGGTHVAWSPVFNHLAEAWLPCLRRMGFEMELTLHRAGFYPQGGGEVTARIEPIAVIEPIQLDTRGALREVRVFSAHTNLTDEVADRQARAAERALQEAGLRCVVERTQLPSFSRNTVCTVTGIFENARVCYTALGEPRKRAERVAEEACHAFLAFLRTDATVDEYLADQLLLPLALASGPSVFRTPCVTQHLLTNMATIQRFVPLTVRVTGGLGEPGQVEVMPASA